MTGWAIVGVIVGALLGAVFSLVFQESLNSLRLRASILGEGSEFTGRFKETLPAARRADVERPERTDRVRSRQRANKVWGEIVREAPEEEANKRWAFRGYVDGPLLVAAFWTTTPRRDPTSYGTIIMKRTDERTWEGQYWRPGTAEDATTAFDTGVLPANKIIWTRTSFSS